MITIKKPYIEQVGDASRLCANIVLPEEEKVMFFEVPIEYGKYLCDEVGDAFLVGLLNYALFHGEDITCEAPISERLLYQIRTYFLDTLSEKRYKKIKVIALPYDKVIKNMGMVGASASGGVDSYYSIVRHLDDVPDRYKLTHLLIANQFNLYTSEEETRRRFKEIVSEAEIIPENYGLEMIPIYTNHNDFLFHGFVQEYSLRICSYAFALQKLFAVYYVSSGVPFKEFSFLTHDSDGFDLFNMSMMSTDTLTFYSSGGEVTRTQKIAYFAEDPFIQRHLKVCNNDDRCNCSKCEKCMRSMLSLDIIGVLEKYDKAFDLQQYARIRNKYLATVISGQLEASSDLLENIKKYNYKVPIMANLYGKTLKRWSWKTKECLKKIKWLRKLYFLLKLDFIIYGKEQAIVYRYGTENEL